MILLFCLTSCGGGGLYTNALPQASEAVGTVTVTRNAFVFGSDYPAGIVIPDIDTMRDTAFVVSTDNPAGVLAIDLNTSPLSISQRFKGVTIPPGNGYPRGPLVIRDAHRAFCLTSSHAIDFDPTTGAVHAAVSLLQPVTLPAAQPLSRPFDMNGDGVPEATVKQWTVSYPGGLAMAGNKLYVSFSNYLQPTPPAAAAPGVIRSLSIYNDTPFLGAPAAPIVTTDYNPTALRALDTHTVLIVNSGVNDIAEGKTVPQTDAGVDFLDPTTDTITAHVGLGAVALAFQPPTVTADGTLAFFPSASYGELYAIDVIGRRAVFDHTHPITITGNATGGDFLTDTVLRADDTLFVGSFTHSALYAVDLRSIVPTVFPATFPDPIVVGFPAGVTAENPSGVNTGIGAVAIRPGTFTGPDLFALTGTPGTLVAINTRGTGAMPATDPGPGTMDPGPTAPSSVSTVPSTGSVVLNYPPAGATAFADAVINFTPGLGAGFGKLYFPNNVLGPPQGGTIIVPNANEKDLLTLGCGGSIVLDMKDYWIADGPGADFIVFENAFSGYVEPGAVSASMDGKTFVEFPCASAAQGYAGCAGIHPTLSSSANGIDPTDVATAGGDAFDLAMIKMTAARYVRIRDLSCTTVGVAGKSGFDLDAVSIVHGMVPK